MKKLQKEIKLFKYVRETAQCLDKRSWEHVTYYENRRTNSLHMIKHIEDMLDQEELDNVKFYIKIIKYAKTSFKRLVLESSEIEENRHHKQEAGH